MGFILPTLDQEKLRIQRDVVSNERRQRYENSPYGLAFIRTCDLLYPLPHPYYDCVIGNIAEIQAASLEDVRQFLLQFYGPNNASLTLVGDFDSANARQLIEKYFGPLPRGPDVPKPDVKQPLLTGVVQEKVEDKLAQLPRFELIWNGSASTTTRRRPATSSATCSGAAESRASTSRWCSPSRSRPAWTPPTAPRGCTAGSQ
jgi:zinc protease